MKIAALYDIHGNLPALEAILGEVREEDFDLVVVGGDVVPGPLARECLETLGRLSLPVRFVRGNGETDVVAAARGEVPARVPEAFREAIRRVAGELTPEQVAELAQWPLTTTVQAPGLGAVLFCHATPRDDFEIFTRLTPGERLEPIFDEAGAELAVCGHTHMQFDRRIGRTRVINAGSVGMPFGAPGAYWATVTPEGVELRRTGYDLDAAAERLAEAGYPTAFEIREPPSAEAMEERFEAAALR